MGFFIDLKENNTRAQKCFQNSALASGLNLLVLAALFTVIFSSTLFFLRSSNGSGVLAQEDVQNVQNAITFDASGTTVGTQDQNDNDTVPVKVILYKDPFENIELKAQAVYVLDTVTGRTLYERNKNTSMPLASLTKVMTAIVATDLADNDVLVTIQDRDIANEGNSGLFAGEEWKLSDILDLTLLTSSNDGASAIASAAGAFSFEHSTSGPALSPKEFFIKKMNEQAQELGCIHMKFNNESGLDINNMQSGAYGTAREVALLFEYILENNMYLLEATTHEVLKINSKSDILHEVKNTNEFVESLPGLIASKTGYTDLAGGNLAIMFDSGIGSPIIVVVLGSTIDGRFEDVVKLYEASLKEISQNP